MLNYFITNELFIEVNNRIGVTAAITEILDKSGISLYSFAAHCYGSIAYMYVVTNDNERALTELKEVQDVRQVIENQVIFIERERWTEHTWTNIASALLNNNIEIDHFYATRANQRPYFVLATLDNHRAADCVTQCE